MLFVVLTAPVSAQLLVRGAAARHVPQTPSTQGTSTARSIELLEDDGARDRRPPTEES